MANVPPLSRADASEVKDILDLYEDRMAFLPNSILTMARRPGIARAFSELNRTVLYDGTAPVDLKILVTLVASNASGCRYCQAHMAVRSGQTGHSDEKIERVWEFEESDLFSNAEKAALRLARDAAIVPNEATREHFIELEKYFDHDQIVEIVAAISLFGYLNRWNDTMATDLEDLPKSVAEKRFSQAGWVPGKHGG